MSRYDLSSVHLPRVTGLALELFAGALESPATRALLMPKILRDAGVEKLRSLHLEAAPTFVPLSRDLSAAGKTRLPPLAEIRLAHEAASPLPRVRDFAEAYRSGRTTPSKVAERLLEAIAATKVGPTALNTVIASNPEDVRAQARASTARFAEGRPLGVLDGVPVGVKDELDQAGYPTTVGTRFLGQHAARSDATIVGRLRAGGALLFGKLNMNEIGINPNGGNMTHGLVRNPHDPTRDTGGSSSGSAAAVAAGLCPIALGADGGGSIRIPAALCGVSGLKATYGRISEHGVAPLCWSVGHVGPIAATVEDLAIAYAVIAGADPHDPLSLVQPPPSLEGFGDDDLEGLRIGVYRPWFEHAAPAIVKAADRALQRLEARGAKVLEVEVGWLDATRIAHAITILTEMVTATERHTVDGEATPFALPTRINLALGRTFASGDYVRAQQVRTLALGELAHVFGRVDLLATPTTAITAPVIPVRGAKEGWSDLDSVTEVMRYAFLGNLTGYPAISVPAGYDEADLPIGLQLMARPWAEHTLLRAAGVVEAETARRRAKIAFDLLA